MPGWGFLGVFDLDRPPGASRRPESPSRYALALDRVKVLDVTGRPNFDALVGIIDELDR